MTTSSAEEKEKREVKVKESIWKVKAKQKKRFFAGYSLIKYHILELPTVRHFSN